MVSDYDIFCGVPGHYDSICYSTYGIIFSNYLPLSSSPALVTSSTTLRLARRIVRRPRFMQRHCRRRHRCNPILIPTIAGAPLIPANLGVMLGVSDNGTGWMQPSIPTRVTGATRGGGGGGHLIASPPQICDPEVPPGDVAHWDRSDTPLHANMGGVGAPPLDNNDDDLLLLHPPPRVHPPQCL